MLTSDELNAFLRDERAWRRAAQRPKESDISGAASVNSKETSWPIFRRGTSDNAFSLKFANSLRSTPLKDNINATPSHPRPYLFKKRWDSSVRDTSVGTAVTDPLRQLLARNLGKRRTTSACPRQPRRQCTASAIREGECQRAAERIRQDFVALEREERRDIMTAARARWEALCASYFKEASNLLFLAELGDRRMIFRAWQKEKYVLASAMQCAQERLTNLTSRQFKQHCQLIHAEALARNRVLNDEKECRDLLERYAYVEYLKALEAEIEACRRRELRLRRQLA